MRVSHKIITYAILFAMKVYFIRHGESASNAQDIHQFRDVPLSERGQEQARKLAERFSDIDFDLLVSSTFTRAIETADIINAKHDKKILESPLFVETKRPSEILGKEYKSTEARAIHSALVAHRDDLDWRYSDEETFTELKERGTQALQFLIEHKAERIVVVSHGDIIRLLLSIMQHEEDISPKLFHRFRYFAPTQNTGVTVCHFGNLGRGDAQEKRWHLISWNDHAHLE